MKLALLVAYDGTDFRGLAKQPGLETVQGVLEERLSRFLRADIHTIAAGRTDAGVHAEGQVFSFDSETSVDPAWLATRLNGFRDIRMVVKGAAVVPDDFDARFSAYRRAYRYRLYLSMTQDPFRNRFSWHVRTDRLDVTAMRAAAKHLIGTHDFASFCRKSPRSSTRKISKIGISILRDGVRVPGRTARTGDEIVVEPVGRSFCHQQVRAITGWLVACGMGVRDAGETPAVLAAHDRHAGAPIAPARGLTLMSVSYRPEPDWVSDLSGHASLTGN